MVIPTVHFRSEYSEIPLRIAKGHFATSHSHINYFVDMTFTKHRLSEAEAAAAELSDKFYTSTIIDTILCLDGTEVIASCMASEMTKTGYMNINQDHDIFVLTPEHTTGSQLIFRDNTVPMIENKHVLVLAASVSTGYTVLGATEAIKYYGGHPVGICSIIANMETCGGYPVTSIFDTEHLWPDYQSSPSHECPLCKKGVKLDAMVNTYGFSSF